jgi:hypothetical protein
VGPCCEAAFLPAPRRLGAGPRGTAARRAGVGFLRKEPDAGPATAHGGGAVS